MIGSLALLLAAIPAVGTTIPIDNAIKGQPIISCGTRTVSIVIETANQFFGNVYVKGFFNQPQCRLSGNSSTSMKINLPITSACGLRRRRVLNPRGLIVDTTIVLMFHPIFMTQVDRAYHVQCNYMESNEEVTQSLDVSTQAPTELPRSADAVSNRKPPTCKYEVLSNDKHGPPIVFATIGETVYHRWTCEAEDNLQYCMTVHSCTADDGQGVGQQLIDDRGCSLDHFLLKNLEYGDDLVAGQEAHVFKFADKPTIFFSCMIRLELKENDTSVCTRPGPCPPTPKLQQVKGKTPLGREELVPSFPLPGPVPHDKISLFCLFAFYNSTYNLRNYQAVQDSQSESEEQAEGEGNEYQLLRAKRDGQTAFDIDVAAPSVEVIDLPEYETDVEKEDGSTRKLQICVSRLSLGIAICVTTCLAGIGVFIYLKIAQKHKRGMLCRQTLPHPDFS